MPRGDGTGSAGMGPMTGRAAPVISSITGASLLVIVTEPTVAGIHDMERVLSLSHHFQIPATIVINKADLNEEMSQKIEMLAREQGVSVLGRIPYDAVVTRAMVAGKTVVEYDGEAVAKAIRQMYEKLLSMTEE